MAGESQQPPETSPDPSTLTTEQLVRVVRAERDFTIGQIEVIRQRLSDMDRATALLNETMNRVPTDVQQAVGHLRELTNVELSAVALQFKERDTRSERESRDNKLAVDAAFAAQEKQAAAQNKSNTEAISKSETSTAETIAKLEKLSDTNNRALSEKLDGTAKTLSDKIDDLKELRNSLERMVNARFAIVESAVAQGGAGERGKKEQRDAIYALGGFIAAVIVVLGSLAAAGVFNGSTP